MASSAKIKTINNKIEQNKAQYDLDRQAADILAWSSENVDKYEFLMGKDVSSGKGLGKANTFKRSEYSPLNSELEKQTDIAKDEHKYFKNQTSVIYSNRKDELKAADGVKVEVDEIANVRYFYIGNKSNNLIDKIFK